MSSVFCIYTKLWTLPFICYYIDLRFRNINANGDMWVKTYLRFNIITRCYEPLCLFYQCDRPFYECVE